MKSLGLWYVPRNGDGDGIDLNLEVHINYWKLPSGNHFKRFLDIGFKIQNPHEIDKIFLYLPFSIDIQDIKDLGQIISGNRELLTAIFNENWQITYGEDRHYIKVTDQNDEFVFNIAIIEKIIKAEEKKVNDIDIYVPTIELNSIDDGCIMKIYLPGRINNYVYLRFRILSSFLEKLSFVYIPHDSFLQSALSKIELLDFRINSIRDLPDNILDQIKNGGKFFLIKKLHFFFICDATENLILKQKSFNKVRILERSVWKKYLPEITEKKPLIAYHWKEIDDNGLTNFNMLIKTKFRHANWLNIVKYLIILILIGITINFISSELFHLNKRKVETISKQERKVSYNLWERKIKVSKQKYIKRLKYVNKNNKNRL